MFFAFVLIDCCCVLVHRIRNFGIGCDSIFDHYNLHHFILDENSSRATQKPKTPTPFRCPAGTDNGLFVNPESIVTIMVESPKEPPNSEFGTSFSSPPPPPSKLDDSNTSVSMTESNVHNPTDLSISNVIIDDIQEPIDVNTPRDTTNIFYAYEETDASVSDPQISIEQSVPVDSNQTNPNVSQVNNQQSESTADQTESNDHVVVDTGRAADATAIVTSNSSSSSS